MFAGAAKRAVKRTADLWWNTQGLTSKLGIALGIGVVLIAEPYFSASALLGMVSDNPIYADIAKAENVPLFAKDDGGWSAILSDETLKSDQIHANAQGYAKFADNLYQFLADQGFI